MPSNFLQTFFNYDLSKDYVPSVADGRFSIANKTVASLQNAGQTYLADLDLRTDFQFAGKNKAVRFTANHSDFSGYNKKYITDTGVYDPKLAMEEFARSAFDRRVVKEDTFAQISSFVQGDSHNAFLYNMLISWQRAYLYASQRGQDEILKIRTSPYRDSHVTIPLDAGDEDHTSLIELGIPYEGDFQVIDFPVRNALNFWSSPYVLRVPGPTMTQVSFYMAHCFGRNNVSNLNAEIAIPCPKFERILLDIIGGDASTPAGFDNIPWHQPDTLWSWIIEYVTLNRLQQPFAAVLETFMAMAIQPQWSSAEACAWQQIVFTVVLGEFSPTRGRIRSNLEGEAFFTDPTAYEFVTDLARSPVTMLQTSAILNYYALYGLYTVLHNEARSRDNWEDVFTSTVAELQILLSPAARAALISTLTRQQFATCMDSGAYIHYDTTNISMNRLLPSSKSTSGDPLFKDGVMIDAIYAPVSGSLILGAVCGDFETTCHLAPLQETKTEGSFDVFYDMSTMLKVCNTFRLFGHEVELRDTLTNSLSTPWATSTECIIEPASIEFKPTQRRRYVVVDSHPRMGRNHTIPNVVSLMEPSHFVVSIRKPTLRVVDWQKRTTACRPIVRANRKKVEVKFFVKTVSDYGVGQFNAKELASGQQDFHRVQTAPTPRMPEITFTPATPPPMSSSAHIVSDIPAAPDVGLRLD